MIKCIVENEMPMYADLRECLVNEQKMDDENHSNFQFCSLPKTVLLVCLCFAILSG